MHSDLVATRRLRELKSEFVESLPVSISIPTIMMSIGIIMVVVH